MTRSAEVGELRQHKSYGSVWRVVPSRGASLIVRCVEPGKVEEVGNHMSVELDYWTGDNWRVVEPFGTCSRCDDGRRPCLCGSSPRPASAESGQSGACEVERLAQANAEDRAGRAAQVEALTTLFDWLTGSVDRGIWIGHSLGVLTCQLQRRDGHDLVVDALGDTPAEAVDSAARGLRSSPATSIEGGDR